MPKPCTSKVLRGLCAQIKRGTATHSTLSRTIKFDDIGLFQLNKFLGQPGTWQAYAKASSNDLSTLKEELKRGPYPTRGSEAIAEFSFGYWYNYFYKELPAGERLEFAEPVLNDDGSFRTEEQVPNKLSLFNSMLRKGFKPFKAQDHLTAQQLLVHAAQNADNSLQANKVNILFRGDGRPWQSIRRDGGTKPQSRIQGLRDARNINRFWHPFNPHQRGNQVWVRNGEVNKDNCLFSAVSVTPQFQVATKFPLLCDLMGSNPSAVGHALLSVRDRTGNTNPGTGGAVARAKAQLASASQDGKAYAIKLPASQTNVYGVCMRGAFNTQAYQGDAKFPEYASDDLGWSDHMVWFKVTRIHFSETDGNAGHLIVVEDYRWLQDDQLLRAAILGPASLPLLQKFVNETASKGRLQGGRGGIVYTPSGVAPPPFEIVSVRESFVPGRSS